MPMVDAAQPELEPHTQQFVDSLAGVRRLGRSQAYMDPSIVRTCSMWSDANAQSMDDGRRSTAHPHPPASSRRRTP